jgi:acyl-CoA thioester hydrolase
MPCEFQITRRVEFSETDMAGIMHFSNFFRFMESAEHAFFRSLGFSVARSRRGFEVCLPRVHAECDYAAPLRFEDEVVVRLLVERKGKRSLTYQFRFCRLDGSILKEVARGRLTVASVECQADGVMKAVPLPKAISDKIQQASPEMLGLNGKTGSRSFHVPLGGFGANGILSPALSSQGGEGKDACVREVHNPNARAKLNRPRNQQPRQTTRPTSRRRSNWSA